MAIETNIIHKETEINVTDFFERWNELRDYFDSNFESGSDACDLEETIGDYPDLIQDKFMHHRAVNDVSYFVPGDDEFTVELDAENEDEVLRLINELSQRPIAEILGLRAATLERDSSGDYIVRIDGDQAQDVTYGEDDEDDDEDENDEDERSENDFVDFLSAPESEIKPAKQFPVSETHAQARQFLAWLGTEFSIPTEDKTL